MHINENAKWPMWGKPGDPVIMPTEMFEFAARCALRLPGCKLVSSSTVQYVIPTEWNLATGMVSLSKDNKERAEASDGAMRLANKIILDRGWIYDHEMARWVCPNCQKESGNEPTDL